MEDISQKLGGDFIVLPSSIHEVIGLSADVEMDRRDLEAMVQDVNAGEVAPEDRLSDHVYMYDSKEKEQLRKAQDRHKYMMGGCVVKYFPEAYDFSEQEMNRIIACAFSLKDVKNMINTVLKERPDPAVINDEEEEENDDFDTDENEENDLEESDDDEGGEA